MIPSRRFVILAAVGLVPAVLAAFAPGLFPVALAYFVVCCALMAGNYLMGVRPEQVRIYPDLREVTRYELMARRSRLEELGVHRSRLTGRGTEFERIRDYTPDDEYRQIDWKATARRHRPMSRVYEVERSQNVFIV